MQCRWSAHRNRPRRGGWDTPQELGLPDTSTLTCILKKLRSPRDTFLHRVDSTVPMAPYG